jgi:hypothetical protein
MWGFHHLFPKLFFTKCSLGIKEWFLNSKNCRAINCTFWTSDNLKVNQSTHYNLTNYKSTPSFWTWNWPWPVLLIFYILPLEHIFFHFYLFSLHFRTGEKSESKFFHFLLLLFTNLLSTLPFIWALNVFYLLVKHSFDLCFFTETNLRFWNYIIKFILLHSIYFFR